MRRFIYCKVVLTTSLVWVLVDVFLLLYFSECNKCDERKDRSLLPALRDRWKIPLCRVCRDGTSTPQPEEADNKPRVRDVHDRLCTFHTGAVLSVQQGSLRIYLYFTLLSGLHQYKRASFLEQ
uniref:Uncharacterized protein n=1 Tax=Monopterus albus TaxID=43700 RepID=A0A3Q3R027_MONAL